jgi:hypothetical protein
MSPVDGSATTEEFRAIYDRLDDDKKRLIARLIFASIEATKRGDQLTLHLLKNIPPTQLPECVRAMEQRLWGRADRAVFTQEESAL